MNKTFKISMIIAPDGFRDEEYAIPYKYFIDHNADVTVFSIFKGTATGSQGMKVKVDHDLSQLDPKNFDAVVFVSGRGTPAVRSDKLAVEIAGKAFSLGKIIGAICWSPTILAKAGILQGKKATVSELLDSEFNKSTSQYLKDQGAIYTANSVTVDGNIITANGPAAALGYAQAIWNALLNKI